jgi:serine/threonine protein kinase
LSSYAGARNKFQSEYEGHKKIGEGSFGIVYECVRGGKLVAVKRTKEKYEGVRDRLQKLDEVLRVFKISQ